MRDWIDLFCEYTERPSQLDEGAIADAYRDVAAEFKDMAANPGQVAREVAAGWRELRQNGFSLDRDQFEENAMFADVCKKYNMRIFSVSGASPSDLREMHENFVYVGRRMEECGLKRLMKGKYVLDYRSGRAGEVSLVKTMWLNMDAADYSTIIHELGHKLNLSLPHSVVSTFVKFLKKDLGEEWFVSKYARTNAMEMFAEIFMEYFTGQLNPRVKKWMQKFITRFRWGIRI